MKKSFLHNKRKKNFLIAAVAVAIFILLFSGGWFSRFISGAAISISKPFFAAENKIASWFESTAYIIEEKNKLKKENIELKEKMREMEAKSLFCGILNNENKELKNLLSRGEGKNYLVAAVIARPPKSPYDILVIDAGIENGIEKGMRATAYSDILLGYVAEVFPKTSKIKLISFPKEETNVFLQSSGISAIAVGKGGENLEIVLPRSININSGENIVSLGIDRMLVGIVDRIEIDITNAFQKILFRLPINIQELKYIMIEL